VAVRLPEVLKTEFLCHRVETLFWDQRTGLGVLRFGLLRTESMLMLGFRIRVTIKVTAVPDRFHFSLIMIDSCYLMYFVASYSFGKRLFSPPFACLFVCKQYFMKYGFGDR